MMKFFSGRLHCLHPLARFLSATSLQRLKPPEPKPLPLPFLD